MQKDANGLVSLPLGHPMGRLQVDASDELWRQPTVTMPATQRLLFLRHLPLRPVCPATQRRTGWWLLVTQLQALVDRQTYRATPNCGSHKFTI